MKRGEKKDQVLAYLRRGVRSGWWQHGTMPKEVDLAAKFGFSRETVRNAYASLAADGLVERRKRRGTVLCQPQGKNPVIAAVMRGHGDFYEDIFLSMKTAADRVNCRLEFVDTSGFVDLKPRRNIRRSLSGLANSVLSSRLIVEGYVFQKYPYISRLLRKKPVFFNFFDGGRPEGVTGVLIDYYAIGKLAAEYLLKNGCRRPLLIGEQLRFRLLFSPERFCGHKDKLLADGFFEARIQKATRIDEQHLLLAILHDIANNGAKQVLELNNMTYDDAMSILFAPKNTNVSNGIGLPDEEEEEYEATGGGNGKGLDVNKINAATAQRMKTASKTPVLDSFGTKNLHFALHLNSANDILIKQADAAAGLEGDARKRRLASEKSMLVLTNGDVKKAHDGKKGGGKNGPKPHSKRTDTKKLNVNKNYDDFE